MRINQSKLIKIFGLAVSVIVIGLIFVFWSGFKKIEIRNENQSSQNNKQEIKPGEGINPLNGLSCQNYQQRPIAVILAGDNVARPLAGVSEADLVLEMPAITGGITRLLAFYICSAPKEIGSVRSARHDFIPLALGFDAILAHWGGSHFVLDQLNNGVIDNINALPNPFNVFYQKSGLPQPHNGFTSMPDLIEAAKKLGYRLKNNFEGYDFEIPDDWAENKGVLKIGYPRPYNLEYRYDPGNNVYWRYRNGLKEIDANNQKQVEAKNVVVMTVVSKQIEGPFYNDLELEGSGECQVYKNGSVISCRWFKSEQNPKSKLRFFDKNNQEISFTPGPIWIEMIEPYQKVVWGG